MEMALYKFQLLLLLSLSLLLCPGDFLTVSCLYCGKNDIGALLCSPYYQPQKQVKMSGLACLAYNGSASLSELTQDLIKSLLLGRNW